MKALNLLFILLVLSSFAFAQNKVSPEEKKARLDWVQKQLKNIPAGAQQKDIEQFYNSLPKSTSDSLLQFQVNADSNPNIILVNPNQAPYRIIPIPPHEGKEKIIPIPLNDPDAKVIAIKK